MPRRVWSTEEDEKLISLVEQFGDKRGRDSKWNEISKNLPGRTNKDCRKRWFHSLDPKLRKGRWTKEEDEILLATHRRLGPAWKEIALLIKGRKDDQCAKRYTDILDPSVKNRLRSWSQEEDHYLTTKVKELGHRWATISSGLPGRPPLTCRNRWRRLCKEIAAMPSYPSQDQDYSTELSSSSGSGSVYPGSSSSGNASSIDNGSQDDGESPNVQLDAMDLASGLSETMFLPPSFEFGDSLLPMRNLDEGYMSLQHDSDMFSHPTTHSQPHDSDPTRTRSGHLPSNENTGMNSIPGDFPSISSPENSRGDRDRLMTDNSDVSGQGPSPTNGFQTLGSDNIRLTLDSLSQGTEPDRNAMEEAAVRQVLMSAPWTSSSPRDVLSRSYPTPTAQEVHHHHHFHHHFHYHHYQHQSHVTQ